MRQLSAKTDTPSSGSEAGGGRMSVCTELCEQARNKSNLIVPGNDLIWNLCVWMWDKSMFMNVRQTYVYDCETETIQTSLSLIMTWNKIYVYECETETKQGHKESRLKKAWQVKSKWIFSKTQHSTAATQHTCLALLPAIYSCCHNLRKQWKVIINEVEKIYANLMR